MRYLITGGAGFIGSHLSELFIRQGHQVTVIDDLSTGRLDNIAHLRTNPNFQVVIETITNAAVMDRLVSECDVIVHLAAAVGVELIVQQPVHTIETNVMGTETVLKTARRYMKKVLIASTSEVYGKSPDVPFSETDDSLMGATVNSRWAYATSKALDEFLSLAYHREMALPVVVFRLFNTVGPRQRGRYGMVLPRFIKQAMQNKPITVYGSGEQSRCFCDVRDVIHAIAGLAENESAIGQVFNIGATGEISILDLARKVKQMTGSESEIWLVPYEEATDKGFEDMQRRIPDTSKINGLLGWQPKIVLDETIGDVVGFFERKGLGDPITVRAMPNAKVVG